MEGKEDEGEQSDNDKKINDEADIKDNSPPMWSSSLLSWQSRTPSQTDSLGMHRPAEARVKVRLATQAAKSF